MPMITKPASISKNAAAEITLDKTVLAALPSVVADDYFSDSSNWNEVLIYFRSSVGNQREILKFDATQATPAANFLVSEKARDVFQVQKIVIKDFDNDSFTVTRSELVVADFDVTLGAGGGGGGGGSGSGTPTLLNWSTGSALYDQSIDYQSVQGAVTLLNTVDNDADGLPDWINTKSVEILSGNLSIEATIPLAKDVFFGFQNQATSNGPQNVTPLYAGFSINAGNFYAFIDIDGTIAYLNEGIPCSDGDSFKVTIEYTDLISYYYNGDLLAQISVNELNNMYGLGIASPSMSYSMGIVMPSEDAPVTLSNIVFETI